MSGSARRLERHAVASTRTAVGAALPLRAVAAGSVEVLPVTGARLRKLFVGFPWQIYAGDPHWTPPLLVESLAFINPRRHPFYRHGAAVQLLAMRDGRPLGRVMASDDPGYNAAHGSNVGCFGLFECVDDQSVADALLDAAADWLRRRGRKQIMGPIDYSTNYPCGLLIDGFDSPQRIMMNHNPPYYRRLLETWGLDKAKDLWSWWFDDPHDMLDRWRRRAQRLQARGDVTIRPIDARRVAQEVALCQEIYNAVWEKHWGFVKMTDAEVAHLAGQLRLFARPELILVAEVAGRPVGFCLTVPDVNEAIRPLNGRLTTFGMPLGVCRLKANLARIKTARMLALGLLPEFRRRGVVELFILRTLQTGKNSLRYTGADLGWTLEDNDLVNRPIEVVGARHYKTFRIFQKSLGS